MVNTGTAYFDQVLLEVLEAATDKPQTSDVQKVNTRAIERMVRQCYALLRQELERKVKLEPSLYSKDRMERVLREFETVIPDIQEAIATRVLDSVAEIIRLEIRRVLRDALSDLQEAVAEPAREEERGRVEPSTSGEGICQPEESLPPSEAHDRPSTPTKRVEGPRGRSGMPQEHAVRRPSGPELHSTVDKPERQHADRSSDTGGTTAQERHEAAGDETYQDDVKVSVETHGSPKQMIRFLNQLSSNPQLRMLRMVGSYQSATLWLALRQPLHLRELLLQMDSVSEVRVCPTRGSGGPEHVLEIVLESLPEVAAATWSPFQQQKQ